MQFPIARFSRAFAALSTLAGLASAASVWDNGDGDRQWFTPANWNPDGVPTAADDALVNAACSEAAPAVIAGGTAWCDELELGTAPGDAGYLDLQSGALTNTSAINERYIGKGGTGWLRVQDGTFYSGRWIVLGLQAGSHGTARVDGGELVANWGLRVGEAGDGRIVQTGGLVTSRDGSHPPTIGNLAGGVGRVWVSNGLFQAAGSSSLFVGGGGHGELYIRGNGTVRASQRVEIGSAAGGVGYVETGDSGSVTSGLAFYVGNVGSGTLVMNGGTATSSGGSSFYVGYGTGGHGTLIASNGTLTAGTSTGEFYVGQGGSGEVYVRGGTVRTFRSAYVGNSSGATGSICHESGTLSISRDLLIGSAAGGIGQLVATAPFTARALYIGNGAGSRGLVEVGPVAVTLGNGFSSFVGVSGNGTLVTHGGTFSTSGTTPDLTIRVNAGATGVIRGWGRFNIADQFVQNGLAVADGEGVERDLDFSPLDGSSANPAWTNSLENVSSNGWYATNKGRLLLCSRLLSSGAQSVNWGESFGDDEIDLVNSLRLTGTLTSSGTLNVKLLAADRSEVPAPPPARRLIGVWDATLTAGFATLDLECRYDHVAAGGQPVALYRWNSGTLAWELLGDTALPGYRIAAASVAPLGTAKIGLVAAAARLPSGGTAIVIQ